MEKPSGQEVPLLEASVFFEGEERGAQLVLQAALKPDGAGLYWFDVLFEEERITRIPLTLLDTIASHLIAGDPFHCELGELTSAALLVERELERDALAATVHAAVAGRWRTADGAVTERGVQASLAPFLHAAIGLGALSDRSDRRRLSLSDVGVELLARSLRRRATPARLKLLRGAMS